jgi:hypothetical protein
VLLYKCHMKFYKSSLNSNSNRGTYKEFFGCLGVEFCCVWWFVFWVLDPLYFWGSNLLISNSFLTIVSVLDVLRREDQVLFGHSKQQSLPLGFGLPWAPKCSIIGSSTLHIQTFYIDTRYIIVVYNYSFIFT